MVGCESRGDGGCYDEGIGKLAKEMVRVKGVVTDINETGVKQAYFTSNQGGCGASWTRWLTNDWLYKGARP